MSVFSFCQKGFIEHGKEGSRVQKISDQSMPTAKKSSISAEAAEKIVAMRCDMRCLVLWIARGISVTQSEVASSSPATVATACSSLAVMYVETLNQKTRLYGVVSVRM